MPAPFSGPAAVAWSQLDYMDHMPIKKSLIPAKNSKIGNDPVAACTGSKATFCMVGIVGVRRVRRIEGEKFHPNCRLPNIKAGKRIMQSVTLFSATDVGPVYPDKGIMVRDVYADELENSRLLFPRRFLVRLSSTKTITALNVYWPS